jgi:hypothetical protein
MKRLRPKLTYANVMATIAVFIALGSASYAAIKLPKNSVGTKQLKKNSVVTAKIKKEAVTAAKVKKGTLTGSQIDISTLGTVPAAQTANVANSVAPSEGWHLVGTTGEPAFQNGWHNTGTLDRVGFYKDRGGVVHLKGSAAGGPSNNVIFGLPPGYRPAAGELVTVAVGCDCPLSSGTTSITVGGPVGGVTLENATVTSVFFDGVTFRAES